MYDEEEVPNMEHMHIVEEEVSLSQSKIVAVPPEEEVVPVPLGPAGGRSPTEGSGSPSLLDVVLS
jgi:hypothetical protein